MTDRRGGGATRARSARASFPQERVWLADRLSSGSAAFRVADRMVLRARVGPDVVAAALSRLTERHEPLRTALRMVGGTLRQVVRPDVEQPVSMLDLRAAAPDERRERLDAEWAALLGRPFALDQAPLWRVTAARTEDACWELQFVGHLAVIDRASVLNLRAEIVEICSARQHGREERLPDLALSYLDHAEAERARLTDDALDALVAHWTEVLRDAPPLHSIPADEPRRVPRVFDGGAVSVRLPAGLAPRVTSLAHSVRASRAAVLLAAYAILVRALSGCSDVLIGLPAAGRWNPDTHPLIGAFANVVVLRVPVHPEHSLAELVVDVERRLTDALAHQAMPFQLLVERLPARRVAGAGPVYQLGFALVSGSEPQYHEAAVEDDLMLEVGDETVRLEYGVPLFGERTARRIAAGYVDILEAAVASAATQVSGLVPAGRLAPAVEPVRTAAAPHPRFRSRPRPGPAAVTWAERCVADIFAEVIGVSAVGATDDFFDLGGHSMAALRAVSRLQERTGTVVPISGFLADASVAAVARLLEESTDEPERSTP